MEPEWSPSLLVNPRTDNRLRMDFLASRGTTKIAIELDGRQHYKPGVFGSYFHDEESLLYHQKRDVFKAYAVMQYGISVLRIPAHLIREDDDQWKERTIEIGG
ncbi:hypothetical protein RCL1_005624 [Eukaryota sp. TZLM3-RCL]